MTKLVIYDGYKSFKSQGCLGLCHLGPKHSLLMTYSLAHVLVLNDYNHAAQQL